MTTNLFDLEGDVAIVTAARPSSNHWRSSTPVDWAQTVALKVTGQTLSGDGGVSP